MDHCVTEDDRIFSFHILITLFRHFIAQCSRNYLSAKKLKYRYLNKTVKFHANGALKLYILYLPHFSNLCTLISVFAGSMKFLIYRLEMNRQDCANKFYIFIDLFNSSFFLEMPGLMLLRKRNCTDKPLEGAKIVGCTHVTAQAAVSKLLNLITSFVGACKSSNPSLGFDKKDFQ